MQNIHNFFGKRNTKSIILNYRLFFIKKIALSMQIFSQMPMCLFSRSFHII
jgi:hypothetical protein